MTSRKPFSAKDSAQRYASSVWRVMPSKKVYATPLTWWLITESAVFNLLLSLEELDDYVNPKPFSEKIYKLEPNGEPPKPKTVLEFGFANKEETQAIDGEQLSGKEHLFEDYCNSDFDEKNWLKKARIKL